MRLEKKRNQQIGFEGIEKRDVLKELFNFHSHSQMRCRQDVAFEELVAK